MCKYSEPPVNFCTSITNIFEIDRLVCFNATISNNITNIAFVGSGENFRGYRDPFPEPSSIMLSGGILGLFASAPPLVS